jgi:hypothetical protein
MMAHIYRKGDPDGLHIEAPRVTMRDGGIFGIEGRALIVGVLPDTHAIPFDQIDWFWIEES